MITNINPFLSYIRTEHIYDDMDGKPYFQDATAFAIFAKSNETLKFVVMIDGTRLVSNVSAAALTNDRQAVKLTDEACSYTVFPDDKVSVVVLEYLSTLNNCKVNNKDGTHWQNGQYVFTAEWDNIGEQLHLIAMEDGNYIFWGNEGLRWGE